MKNRETAMGNCYLRLSVYWMLSMLAVACVSAPAPSITGPAPTVESLSRNGPYEIRAYTTAPVPEEYARATIYYPLETEHRIGGIAIAPGFTQSQRHINWWGSRLASHGYAVLVLDTNSPQDRPEARAAALMSGIDTLQAENSRRSSPLYSRLDSRKMAVMGHSMGGGGAMIAANNHGDRLRASIPFTPWQPDGNFSNTTVPTLVLAGEEDTIAAIADHAWPHYASLPSTTPKVYLEVAGGDHFVANNVAEQWHPLLGRYAIAWLKLYMDGDMRYADFIYGDIPRQDAQNLSRYFVNPQ